MENEKNSKMNAEELALKYAEEQAAKQNAANIPPAKKTTKKEL
jgi:hypothetical protein